MLYFLKPFSVMVNSQNYFPTYPISFILIKNFIVYVFYFHVFYGTWFDSLIPFTLRRNSVSALCICISDNTPAAPVMNLSLFNFPWSRMAVFEQLNKRITRTVSHIRWKAQWLPRNLVMRAVKTIETLANACLMSESATRGCCRAKQDTRNDSHLINTPYLSTW